MLNLAVEIQIGKLSSAQYINALQWLMDNWLRIEKVMALNWEGFSDRQPHICYPSDIAIEISLETAVAESNWKRRRSYHSLEITFKDETTATIATIMFA